MQKQFEFLEHTADIKFRSYGKTIEEAFENALRAVSCFIAKDNSIKPKRGRIIEVSGTDKENLLYRLVEEILTLVDTDNFVIAHSKLTFLGNNIRAEIFGDDASGYEGLDLIKAPTYAEMYVKETKTGWEIQMVLDV